VVALQPGLHDAPDVLDGVEVGAVPRPVQDFELAFLGLEEGHGGPALVARGAIL